MAAQARRRLFRAAGLSLAFLIVGCGGGGAGISPVPAGGQCRHAARRDRHADAGPLQRHVSGATRSGHHPKPRDHDKRRDTDDRRRSGTCGISADGYENRRCTGRFRRIGHRRVRSGECCGQPARKCRADERHRRGSSHHARLCRKRRTSQVCNPSAGERFRRRDARERRDVGRQRSGNVRRRTTGC